MAWLKSLKSVFSGAARPEPTWEEAREIFFKAIKKDDTATIEKIAAKYPGETVNWDSGKGSPLHVALNNGSLKAFAALLALGADANEACDMKPRKGSWETSLLHRAIEKNQLPFAALLIDKGANLEKDSCRYIYSLHFESTFEYFTPLASAIKEGNKDAVVLLLERGASARGARCCRINQYSESSFTAVEYAAEKKQFVIADIIKRADIIRAEYLAKQPPAPKAETANIETAPAEPVKVAVEIAITEPEPTPTTPAASPAPLQAKASGLKL